MYWFTQDRSTAGGNHSIKPKVPRLWRLPTSYRKTQTLGSPGYPPEILSLLAGLLLETWLPGSTQLRCRPKRPRGGAPGPQILSCEPVPKPVGNGYWLLPEAGGFTSTLLGGRVGSVLEQQIICATFSFRVPPILHPPR